MWNCGLWTVFVGLIGEERERSQRQCNRGTEQASLVTTSIRNYRGRLQVYTVAISGVYVALEPVSDCSNINIIVVAYFV